MDIQAIPQTPGVYVFRNSFGEIIYVGKAKRLRRRVSSYLRPSRLKTADPKLRSLIKSIADFEVYEVHSESEALLLESQLIKKYSPRYNIELRDDKRFFLFKIDLTSPFPRLTLARLKKNDGAEYFGPFPNAGAVKETLNFLIRHFGIRSCRARIPGEKEYKHCLLDIVRNCSAPCIGKVSTAEYRRQVEKLCDVLRGKTKAVTAELQEEMQLYVKEMQFEKAASLRDIIDNLKSLFAKTPRKFLNAKIGNSAGDEAVKELKKMLHLPTLPKRIECFDNSNLFGSQAVASMVCFIDGEPATSEYRRFRVKTVEGIDDFASMTEIVGRRYKRVLDEQKPMPDLIVIDGGKGQLSAALEALEKLGIEPVLFDRFEKVGAVGDNQVIIMGLAKKQEELFIPGLIDRPVRLPKHTKALRLLQFIRDEAHRFAITFHREYRNKAISNSLLDDIEGIGEKRKKLLLSYFGSVAQIKKASLKSLTSVDGIGEGFAEKIYNFFHTGK